MTDMNAATKAKTDQLNFDDISGRTLTIKITGVTIKPGDQPVTVHFEGDQGKPYKPCKSMCRVMVHNWGADSKAYVGRSMTLYGDQDVKFGGLKVGGIRISHMSNISEAITMALTVTKANKKAFTVRPLSDAPKPSANPAPVPAPANPPAPTISEHDKMAKRIKKAIETSPNIADLDALWNVDYRDDLDDLKKDKPDYHERLSKQRDCVTRSMVHGVITRHENRLIREKNK